MEITCINTIKSSEEESIIAAMERNDCVVRAISSSFDVSYDKAHAYVKEVFQRRDQKGTRGTALKMSKLSAAFGKKITKVGEKQEDGSVKLIQRYRMNRQWKEGGYTTVSFLKKFPTGTYLVFVRQHAFTIKDGVVYGNPSDGSAKRKRIKQAFKIG